MKIDVCYNFIVVKGESGKRARIGRFYRIANYNKKWDNLCTSPLSDTENFINTQNRPLCSPTCVKGD